jgi:hypothetical protein
MRGLDIVGMIVSTCASHPFTPLVVGDHVAVLGERSMAIAQIPFYSTILRFKSFRISAWDLNSRITSRVVRVIDATNAQPVWTWFSRLLLPHQKNDLRIGHNSLRRSFTGIPLRESPAYQAGTVSAYRPPILICNRGIDSVPPNHHEGPRLAHWQSAPGPVLCGSNGAAPR